MTKTIVRRTGTASLETLKETRVATIEGENIKKLVRDWAKINLKVGDYMIASPANLAADYTIFNLLDEGETHPEWEDVKNLFYLVAYSESNQVITIED